LREFEGVHAGGLDVDELGARHDVTGCFEVRLEIVRWSALDGW
jgi:hypothetical protein